MSEKTTKEELARSALGWGTPFLQKGGLLWLLSDMLSEVGDDIGDGPAAMAFREALESTVIGLERQRDALADALRELLDDVTNSEDDWIAGSSVQRARALLAEVEAKP